MKKLFGALILTACASMLNAYDGCSSCPGGGCPDSGCPSTSRCQQGCNPRSGFRTNPAYQQQQGPAVQYQQGQYPEGQYQQYPQGPYQQSQYQQYSQDTQQYSQQYGAPAAYDQQYAGQPAQRAAAQPNAQQMDLELTKKIQDSLHSIFNDKYNNVHVTVSNGVVTLQGMVSSESDKKDLEEKVRDMEGVQNVNNQVNVQPQQKQAYSGANQGQGYYQNQNPNPNQNVVPQENKAQH